MIMFLGRGGRTPDSGNRRGNNEPSSTLFVKNLSYSTTEESLMSAFDGCVSARLPTDRETGKKRGYSFVCINVMFLSFTDSPLDLVMLSFPVSLMLRKHLKCITMRNWMVVPLCLILPLSEVMVVEVDLVVEVALVGVAEGEEAAVEEAEVVGAEAEVAEVRK